MILSEMIDFNHTLCIEKRIPGKLSKTPYNKAKCPKKEISSFPRVPKRVTFVSILPFVKMANKG